MPDFARRWRGIGCLAALVVAGLAAPAHAGEYHWRDTLVCSDCHLPREGDATTGGPPLRNTGDALCLECHDGRGDAPDVRGENTGTHVRQAGALPTGIRPYQGTNGHELGVSAVPPGGMMAVTLHCTSCHNAHGTPFYRNLPSVTYAKARNDPTKDVFVRGWTRGDIAGNYGTDAVEFNEPSPTRSGMAEFCQSCHRDFHTAAMSFGAWLRHPTAGANISPMAGGHSSLSTFASRAYRVKVMSPTGDWGPRGAPWPAAPSTLTPTCITCHRAHGNRNPFALIAPTGVRPITEEGDGRVPVSLCRQCHAQGGWQPGPLAPWQAP